MPNVDDLSVGNPLLLVSLSQYLINALHVVNEPTAE